MRSRALPCCRLARKANQRLELFILALLYCPVVESISDAGKFRARVIPVSCEFSIVQVLEGPKNLSGLWIVRCPRLGVFLSRAGERKRGGRANTKYGGHNIDYVREL